MRVPIVYLADGPQWRRINGITLTNLTIEWGTEDPSEQPEPAVVSMQLFDRDGSLAGRCLTLAGRRVKIAYTPSPTWAMFAKASPALTYGQAKTTWIDLVNDYQPTPDVEGVVTLIIGSIDTGGKVEPASHGWLISLYLTSELAKWKRVARLGPTTTDKKYEGLHWVGSSAARKQEIINRAASSHLPPITERPQLQIPQGVAPYELSEVPSLLELVRKLYGLTTLLPLWDIRYADSRQDDTGTLYPSYLISDANITLHANGSITTRDDDTGQQVPALPGHATGLDNKQLTIPSPVTQISVNGYRAKADEDGKLSFSEAEHAFDALGKLPDNLLTTQKSHVIDTDAVIFNDAGAAWPWGQESNYWTQNQKETFAQWLLAANTRLRPATIIVRSDLTSPDQYPGLFHPRMSGPWTFSANRYTGLIGDDAMPAMSGAWRAIGGKLRFDWRDKKPLITHELTMFPVPRLIAFNFPIWEKMQGFPLTYGQANMTWAEFMQITTFEKE